MTIAFDTGKVRIGLCHIPKPMPIHGDAVKLQSALLEPRTCLPLTPVQRVLGAIWRFL